MTSRIFSISMRRTGMVLVASIGLIAGTMGMASATDSPVQSPARPFGLEIVADVQTAGSDAASATFQTDVLPTVQSLINLRLSELMALSNVSSYSVDPSHLTLTNEADVRAYFIGEGAGYHNTLGFNTLGGGIGSGDPKLIFPDVSSPDSYYDPSGGGQTLTNPLMAGDFVNLGRFAAGTSLDFFLIANGVYGGSNVYSTDTSINPDGIQHAIAFQLNDSPYLIIGFEDLFGGGDMDYNDALFALDLGPGNAPVSNPEPATMILLGSFLGLYKVMGKRTRKAESV